MNKTREILDKLNINYQWYNHKPIITLQDAIEVDKELNLVGEETKNLFLKDKKTNNYYVFITLAKNKFGLTDNDEINELKLKIASSDELEQKSGYVRGSAATFPFSNDTIYLVDNSIFNVEYLICSGGNPTESYVMKSIDLKNVFEYIDNKIIYVNLLNNL